MRFSYIGVASDGILEMANSQFAFSLFKASDAYEVKDIKIIGVLFYYLAKHGFCFSGFATLQ